MTSKVVENRRCCKVRFKKKETEEIRMRIKIEE